MLVDPRAAALGKADDHEKYFPMHRLGSGCDDEDGPYYMGGGGGPLADSQGLVQGTEFIQRIIYHTPPKKSRATVMEFRYICPVCNYRSHNKHLNLIPKTYRYFCEFEPEDGPEETKGDAIAYLAGLPCCCHKLPDIMSVEFVEESTQSLFGDVLTVDLLNECIGPGSAFLKDHRFHSKYLRYILPTGQLIFDTRISFMNADADIVIIE